MADTEREVKITITGRNLTGPEFEKARQALAGVRRESDSTRSSSQKLKDEYISLVPTLKNLAGALGVTFGVGAIVGFTRQMAAAAGQIVDLSAKLGLSVTAVQRYGYVADQTGGSVEQWGAAIFKVGVTIAQGSEKVRKAASELGLPYQELQRLRPEDQFDRIMRALSGIESPQTRNRLGVELMGKSYANVAAAVDDYIKLLQEAPAASEASVKATDAAADATARAWSRAKAVAIESIGNIFLAIERNQAAADAVAERSKGQPRQFIPSYGGFGDLSMPDSALELGRRDSWLQGTGIDVTRAPRADVALGKQIEQVASYTDRLRAARVELSQLTAAQRAEIDAGLKLGQTMDEIGDQYGLSAEAQKLYASTTKEQTRTVAEATAQQKAAAAAAQQWKEQQDKLFGRDTIAQAKSLVDMVGGFPQAWRMTDAAQKQVLGTLHEALAAYRKLGIEAPESVRRLATELEFLSKVQPGNAGIQAFTSTSQSVRLMRPAPTFATSLEGQRGNAGVQTWLASLGRPTVGLGSAPGKTPIQALFGMTSTEFGANLGKTITGAVMGGGNVGEAVGSSIGQSIGTNIAKNSGKALEGIFGKTVGSTIAAAIPGIGALLGPLAGKLVGKVVSLFTGGEGAKANDLRDQLKAKFGDAAGAGLQAMVDKFKGVSGVSAAYEQFMRGGSQKDVQASFDLLTRTMQEAEATMQKYGLSLDDARTPQERFTSSAKDLQKEIATLTGLGFSNKQMAQGMAKELNGLVRAAMDSGGKMPAAFKPLLEELVKGGLLADDLRDRLLGIPAKVKAPWKEMQAIAEEFGIDITKLGTNFEQSRLIEGGEELARKWRVLIDNGADMVEVNAKMADKANEYLRAALRWGLEVPPSMKPMLEKMLEAGELTDDNGEKLTSLGEVKWGTDAAAQFEPLTEALWALVDIFREDLPASLDELRRNAERGFHIPVDTEGTGNPPDPSGDEDNDGVENQYDSYPYDDTRYASGGIAAGRQIALLAEQGKKEIVGDIDFMTRALTGALSNKTASDTGRALLGGAVSSSTPVQIVIPISVGGRYLESVIVDTTADAMAQGRIPVPARVVQGQVSRG